MRQLDSPGAWRLLFHLLQRGAERGDEQAEAEAHAHATRAPLLAEVSEAALQHVVRLLATFAESARRALGGISAAGLRRCDGRTRQAAAVPYARAAPRAATAATREAARLRQERRETQEAQAQLLVAADPRLIALRDLLRPGGLPTCSYEGLLRGVLALRQSDAQIGATQVAPTTDVLDVARLASDAQLGLQARMCTRPPSRRARCTLSPLAAPTMCMHAHTLPSPQNHSARPANQARVECARSAAHQLSGDAGAALDVRQWTPGDVETLAAQLDALTACHCPPQLRAAALLGVQALTRLLLQRARDWPLAHLVAALDRALPLLRRDALPADWARPPAECDERVRREQERCARLVADGRDVGLLWPPGKGKSRVFHILAQLGYVVVVISPLASVRAGRRRRRRSALLGRHRARTPTHAQHTPGRPPNPCAACTPPPHTAPWRRRAPTTFCLRARS